MRELQGASPAALTRALCRPNAALRLVLDADGAPSGRAEMLDDAYRTTAVADLGRVFDTMPCFARGTRIATERGEQAVEALRPDDRVVTRDHGLQPVVWVGTERLGWRELGVLPVLRPVRFRGGALGRDAPARDLIVSPNHHMLVAADGDEVLVTAHSLVGLQGVEVVATPAVDYVQLLLPRHDVVLANGAWTESFRATDDAVAALSESNRSAVRAAIRDLGLMATPAAARRLQAATSADLGSV